MRAGIQTLDDIIGFHDRSLQLVAQLCVPHKVRGTTSSLLSLGKLIGFSSSMPKTVLAATSACIKHRTCFCRGPEQIVRGDKQGQRPGKNSQFKHSSATERGRAVLAKLMAEDLGDQVLLLRLYQVHTAALMVILT